MGPQEASHNVHHSWSLVFSFGAGKNAFVPENTATGTGIACHLVQVSTTNAGGAHRQMKAGLDRQPKDLETILKLTPEDVELLEAAAVIATKLGQFAHAEDLLM